MRPRELGLARSQRLSYFETTRLTRRFSAIVCIASFETSTVRVHVKIRTTETELKQLMIYTTVVSIISTLIREWAHLLCFKWRVEKKKYLRLAGRSSEKPRTPRMIIATSNLT
jgi:hypothetical protein